MSLPYDRDTIIGVVNWLISHPDLRLTWTAYEPPFGYTGGEDHLGIDGEDALAIMEDPAAFLARVNDELFKGSGATRKAWDMFQEMHHEGLWCQATTARGKRCSNRVVHGYVAELKDFDPTRPEHRFCRKHLSESGEVPS